MNDTVWTDERLDALKTLWKGDLSAAEIAAELGGGLTRNAVLGKVHRLKLEKRVNNWHDKKSGRASAPKQPRRALVALPKSRPSLVHPEPVVPPPVLVEPTGRGVSIHALDNLFEMCRWIVSPDPTRRGRDRYCGEPTVKGCSWCGWHKAKALTKQAPVAVEPEKKKAQHRPSLGDRSFGAVAW